MSDVFQAFGKARLFLLPNVRHSIRHTARIPLLDSLTRHSGDLRRFGVITAASIKSRQRRAFVLIGVSSLRHYRLSPVLLAHAHEARHQHCVSRDYFVGKRNHKRNS